MSSTLRDVAAEASALFARVHGPAQMTTDDLPAPVQRWLSLVVSDVAAPVRTVRLRHGGTFRTSLEGAWRPIRGEQYFTADPPAFLWWGRIRMLPAVWVDGLDSSVDGEGRMRVRVFSRFPLVDARGPDLDQGALLRLLGEMFWLPPVLADRQYVTWAPLDDRRATATLRVGGRTAEGTFEFGDDGLLIRFRALRMRDVGGAGVLTPFEGDVHDHRRVDGLLVPHRVVGAWIVDGARKEYARFEVERFEVNRAEPFEQGGT